jgi:hypothetical protein
MGYQVVEVAHEAVPVLLDLAPTADPDPEVATPEPARLPSSPVGYQVVQVAEEKVPVQPRAASTRARPSRKPPLRKGAPMDLWVPIVVVGLVIVASVGAVAIVSATTPTALPPEKMAMADAPAGPVGMPPGPQVNLPGVPAAQPPAGRRDICLAAGPEEMGPAGPAAAVNLPKPAALPAGPKDRGQAFADVGACDRGKGGNLPDGRETFGTAVAFARNPQQAAKDAGREDKLTFLLHVSGNFEDDRFT